MPSDSAFDPPAVEIALEHWERVARARWKSGLAVFLTISLLAAALIFLSRPIYRAEARLRLGEPPPMSGVSPATGILSFFRTGGDPFANDMELLASRSVAEEVVKDAALNVAVDAPRGWHRDSLFSALRATRSTTKAHYQIRRTGEGSFTIRMTSPVDSLIGTVRPGQEITFGGVILALKEYAGRTVGLRTIPFGEAVRLTRQRIAAERARRDANVVDISFTDPDPGLATAVVSAAVSRFVALRAAVQHRESGQTIDSLRTVARETEADLTRAEAALQAWQERTRLVATEEQSKALVGRYSDLSARLAATRGELDALDRTLARATDTGAGIQPWTDLVSLPRFVENTMVGQLVGQLTVLDGQRVALAARRTPANREFKALNDQLQRLEATLRSVVVGYRSGLAQQVAELTAQVRQIDSALAGAPSLTLELARRQRDVRLLGETYLLTKQRLGQEELREALTFSNVQVIDPPALLFKPVWPRKGLGMGIGELLAGLFGLLAMLAHDRADRSVRTARDITAALRAPILLVVSRPDSGTTLTAEQAARLARHGAKLALGATGQGEGDNGALTAALARSLSDAGVVTMALNSSVDAPDGAAAAAASGAEVVLVVELGRTSRPELARAVRLLAASGVSIAGAIVVSPKIRDGRLFWT